MTANLKKGALKVGEMSKKMRNKHKDSSLKEMFDPTEPKWAVNFDTFPPDKESAWAYPPEEDGWTQSHNALRMELAAFAEAIILGVATALTAAAYAIYEK